MYSIRYSALAGACVLSAALAPASAAQQAPRDLMPEGWLPITMMVCELPIEHEGTSHMPPGHVHMPIQRGSGGPTATFQVTYNGFSAPAQAAFQAALDVWATHIASAIPIKVTANWTPLGANVLGSAGSNGLFTNFSGAPLPLTWYGNALADAISGTDVGVGPELTANFNSNFASWYFGTDGNPPINQWDLMAVVMHEVGHGLGFFGRGVVDDGNPGTGQGTECNGVINEGCWGISGLPVIYDRFVEDQAGASMIDPTAYTNYSIAVGTLLRSSQLYANGPTLTGTLGTRGRLYAPFSYQYGSSYSHFGEGEYPAGSPNAMMTPQIANGESFDSPGPAVCALFNDLGWPLGPDCVGLIVLPANEPIAGDAAASLEFAGPNPFTGSTALRLTLRDAGDVRAELMDVTGRVVATLLDGPVAAGAPVELAVDARSLPTGVYVVRVVGESFTASRRIVHAR
jgi:hypothetical protein